MTSLAGRHAIVTAGPTIEAIDPVRFLSNRSSGRQGYAIAEALADLGASVTLVSGPTCLDAPSGVTRLDVESARDMLAAVVAKLPADIFIAVAAVADWRPARAADRKSDKAGQTTLQLVENPDILRHVAGLEQPRRPGLVIGFAAETHDVLDRARAKRLRKGCDWIVANDVSGDAMGGNENAAILITSETETAWPRASKSRIAEQLAVAVSRHLAKA
ncbi:phosphopantothenoylcysteine decarboxylase [Hyphobacterium sp. Y6023]|uniref:Phosphopantothenoylcysteine decarboxylase n=1 Tax=Hyphobacterium marinum TaxID=3116574 RepID=A0ABU7LVC0_9PROT|nr:phosphopantothenoylcysteine decarboxylase [Hyphobacterium sp. Y6023]MEE2565479.1 phosphopantothenoylcysteine decarboxylase [Hyphobacterium sp. Y6023]